MCGITGWVNFRRDLTGQMETMKRMAKTLEKRGPDDFNCWFSRHCAFGHTRLTVVDPAGGKQPMTRSYQGRNYTICYNGELYNTEDIRRELIKLGHQFQSHSDTEVLLQAYIAWEENCLKYLNGIYAFAIWDATKQRLFAARDRLGVKPFFYTVSSVGLLFGSEQKAIIAHDKIKAEVDREGLQEIFGVGPSRTPEHGVFRGIKSLRPGHALSFSKDGLKKWRYWNVESKPHEDTLEETAEKVRDLFTDSVIRQLVSDVPISTFLSGGVDSSAISAIASDHFKKNGKGALDTFSIAYTNNDKYFKTNTFQPNSDEQWIEKMVSSLGSNHHAEEIDTEELVTSLKEAVIARDLPGMADVDSSLLWFCKQIKKKTTVSLSGECADEIFGGYPWFHNQELLFHEGFPWMQYNQERENILKPDWRNKLMLPAYQHERYHQTIAETPKLEGESKTEARRRELFYLNIHWFMTTLLDRKDRMSMGASLEVRVPFSDHRIVEYAWNIPWEMKMTDNREKGILRKALKDRLPDEILYRKKSPYPKTHSPHYTKAVKSWLLRILDDASSPLLELIDERKVRYIAESDGKGYQAPWFGQLMTGPQMMAYLIQVNIWLKTYNINIVK
ncbi:asparagine synthase (glutamine-hydrolyzing) [Virgibacillus kimchii]